MTLWSKRLVASALTAAVATGLPVGATAAPPEPQAPQTSWQLRAQVRPDPGARLSKPKVLPDALRLMRRAACRRARDLLWDGEPGRSRVRMTIWRQSGTPDETHAPEPGVDCHEGFAAESAFRLKARLSWPEAPGDMTATGPMALGPAVAKAGQVANALADRVLQTGEQPWITVRMWRVRKTPRRMVRALARRHQVRVATAVHVAACESGFRPRAFSYPYAGIFQQDVRYWAGRARHYGHPGESPFDAFANIDVSLKMARAAGWGHWGCA